MPLLNLDVLRNDLRDFVATLPPKPYRATVTEAPLPSAAKRNVALIASQAVIQAKAGLEDDYMNGFLQFCRLAQLKMYAERVDLLNPKARGIWAAAFTDFGWQVSKRGSVPRFSMPWPTIPRVTDYLARQVKLSAVLPLIEQSLQGEARTEHAKALLRKPGITTQEDYSFQTAPVFTADDRLCVGLFFAHYTAVMLHGNGRPAAEWKRDYDNFGSACVLTIKLADLDQILPVVNEETERLGRLIFEEIQL